MGKFKLIRLRSSDEKPASRGSRKVRIDITINIKWLEKAVSLQVNGAWRFYWKDQARWNLL